MRSISLNQRIVCRNLDLRLHDWKTNVINYKLTVINSKLPSLIFNNRFVPVKN